MGADPAEIYRDRWLLVVHKPSGVPTQSTQGGEDGLYEQLCARERYVGLHHRLDRPASGLVLFTLAKGANRGISAAIQSHSLARSYAAVLVGEAADGSWTHDVDRKRARSHVTVLGRGEGLSAVEVALETGRKHQIRVQAAMSGTPVAGDRRYGAEAGRIWPRLALHAWRLALVHPITKEHLALESPIPEDLRELWTRAGGG